MVLQNPLMGELEHQSMYDLERACKNNGIVNEKADALPDHQPEQADDYFSKPGHVHKA